jgi:hypothetical protein
MIENHRRERTGAVWPSNEQFQLDGLAVFDQRCADELPGGVRRLGGGLLGDDCEGD